MKEATLAAHPCGVRKLDLAVSVPKRSRLVASPLADETLIRTARCYLPANTRRLSQLSKTVGSNGSRLVRLADRGARRGPESGRGVPASDSRSATAASLGGAHALRQCGSGLSKSVRAVT